MNKFNTILIWFIAPEDPLFSLTRARWRKKERERERERERENVLLLFNPAFKTTYIASFKKPPVREKMRSSSKIFLSYVDIKGREVNSGSAREGELEDKDIKYNIGSHSFWLLLYLNGATTCGTNYTWSLVPLAGMQRLDHGVLGINGQGHSENGPLVSVITIYSSDDPSLNPVIMRLFPKKIKKLGHIFEMYKNDFIKSWARSCHLFQNELCNYLLLPRKTLF